MKLKIGFMDEEDSVQEHSLESEQPKKRTREAKKDEKRKKEKKRSSSVQELSPEGGKCYVSSVRFLLLIFTVILLN